MKADMKEAVKHLIQYLEDNADKVDHISTDCEVTPTGVVGSWITYKPGKKTISIVLND